MLALERAFLSIYIRLPTAADWRRGARLLFISVVGLPLRCGIGGKALTNK